MAHPKVLMEDQQSGLGASLLPNAFELSCLGMGAFLKSCPRSRRFAFPSAMERFFHDIGCAVHWMGLNDADGQAQTAKLVPMRKGFHSEMYLHDPWASRLSSARHHNLWGPFRTDVLWRSLTNFWRLFAETL